MADYNIIQITPEKVELACMQTKPKPNACPPSNITTINPPCKPEQNVVAIDLVQLRQVLNQAYKDVTERLKVYATLENLKEEVELKSVIIGSSINDLSQRLDELQNCATLTAVIPVVDCTGSLNNSYTLSPNKKYIFGTKSALTIALELPTDTTIVNHYYFEFISGSTATTLSLPASIKWIAGPSIKSNKTYLISIENNLGVIQEWS